MTEYLLCRRESPPESYLDPYELLKYIPDAANIPPRCTPLVPDSGVAPKGTLSLLHLPVRGIHPCSP